MSRTVLACLFFMFLCAIIRGGGGMYVIIGSHFVPLEGKFILIVLVIAKITFNVIVRQMPLNVH